MLPAHVALAVQPRLDARLRPIALVLHGAHHGLGESQACAANCR
jgi:hypothetical protein